MVDFLEYAASSQTESLRRSTFDQLRIEIVDLLEYVTSEFEMVDLLEYAHVVLNLQRYYVMPPLFTLCHHCLRYATISYLFPPLSSPPL